MSIYRDYFILYFTVDTLELNNIEECSVDGDTNVKATVECVD